MAVVLRPLPAAPLVVRRRYLIEVPRPLPAVPLVVRRRYLTVVYWPLPCCASRVLNRGVQADAHGATQVIDCGAEAVARPLPAVPFLVRSRCLIVVPRPLPAAPLAVRRSYLIEVPRPVPRPFPEATRRCRSRRRTLSRRAENQSKYYELHLQRGQGTHKSESLSGAMKSIVRIRNVRRSHATPVRRAQVFTVNKGVVRKAPGARQHATTTADNAKELCYPFARLAGSRVAHKATARTRIRPSVV